MTDSAEQKSKDGASNRLARTAAWLSVAVVGGGTALALFFGSRDHEASDTSERGADSRVPHMRAVYDAKGRMMVLITHNTDIADGWEREGEDQEYFYLFSPEAYAIAVNVLVWVMTH